MIDLRAAALIAVCAGVTLLLRFLPFLVFGGKKEVPGYITYLSGVLPYAIMGMLVVYCLKNVNLFAGTHGIPEILASAAVVGLHVWKRNTLLSIAVGTVFYMFLVQVVFYTLVYCLWDKKIYDMIVSSYGKSGGSCFFCNIV